MSDRTHTDGPKAAAPSSGSSPASWADKAVEPMRRSRLLAPALMLAGLLPTLGLAAQLLTLGTGAAQQPDEEPAAGDDESGGIADLAADSRDPTARLLRQIPTDPSVLINVSGRDLPSSPDILNLGRRSTAALERCLADNVDSGARVRCAAVLEALGDRHALPTLQAAVEDWDPAVRARVVEALRAMPDASSVEPLLKLHARKDEEPYIRYGVIRALGALSDQRVVKLLREELKKKPDREKGEADERSVVLEALWQSRHLMARSTLEGDLRYCLDSEHDSLVLFATEAASELRSPKLVQGLIPLMEHRDVEVRNKAVYALGKIGDKTASSALLDHLPKVREARMLNNIAFALERLDKDAFYRSIGDIVGHKQAIIRLNAAFVLGDVKHAEGRAMLENALDDPSDFVRTSAIAALAKLGLPEAIPAVERFVSDDKLAVREEAIYALDKLTPGGRADLIHDRLFHIDEPDEHPEVLRRAAISLGRRGDPRVADYLLTCMDDRGCPVRVVRDFAAVRRDARTTSRVLVAWTRGNDGLTALLADLKPQGTFAAASGILDWSWAHGYYDESKKALDVLGALAMPEALPLLSARAKSDDAFVRLHAAAAMARVGDADAAAVLADELDNLAAERMMVFANVVSRIAEPSARERLDPLLLTRQSSPDTSLALAAAAVRLHWDPEQAAFRFLDALASPQAYERDLAERYLSRNRDERLTWILRRMLAREGRDFTRDRLRTILDHRG